MPARIECGHDRPATGRCPTCHRDRVRAARAADPTRHILVLMIQRCHNPKHPRYPLYGERGIVVCEEWRDKETGYARFLEHVGPRPSLKHSIDRYPNNDGNYEPGNVRWATQYQQMGNTRRTRKFVVDGEEKNVSQLGREYGITDLPYRLAHGHTIEQALSTPIGIYRRLITYNGRTLNAMQWSAELGGNSSLVANRLAAGWSEADAVSVPTDKKHRRPRKLA